MKGKNGIYRPADKVLGTNHLSTLRLFKENEQGRLVVPERKKRPVDNPLAGERRRMRRREWRHDARCRLVAPGGLGGELPVRTFDISRGGVCLLLEHYLEPGTFLDLTAEGVAAPDPLPLIRVVHIVPRGNVWIAGCMWLTRLQREELDMMRGKEPKQRDVIPAEAPGGFLQRLWQKFYKRDKAA